MDTIVAALNHMAPVLWFLLGIFLIADLLWVFATFDQLIKREFQKYPSQWKTNGKPPSVFWKPSVSAYSSWAEWFREQWLRGWHQMAWLFSTPAWVRDDPVAGRLVCRLRILVAIWSCGFLLPFGAAAIAGAFHL